MFLYRFWLSLITTIALFVRYFLCRAVIFLSVRLFPLNRYSAKHEYARLKSNRRRSRPNDPADTLDVSHWFILLFVYSSRCAFCGMKLDADSLTLEHLKRVADGGDTSFTNCVPACHDCNDVRNKLHLLMLLHRFSAVTLWRFWR